MLTRETQAEIVNICIVNILRCDMDHRLMLIEKITQNITPNEREEIQQYLSLPSKKEIVIEAKSVYDKMNNSGELEAVRQAKTAQLMFLAGASFGRGLKR